jgi:hypothetical protein
VSYSCNKEIFSSQTPKSSLLGTWVKLEDKTEVSIKTFIKKDTFEEHQFGYSFMANNKLTVRVKLACGKPPIYGNTTGTYQKSGESLHLSYKVSGRPNESDLKILKLTKDTLKLEY